jgi:GNAT superfamily N-acetyltransferase
MVFELTDSLAEKLVHAMENQEEHFVLDAGSCAVVLAEDAEADEENFYTLPSWSSEDGYKMLESFVSSLYAPLVREELRQVLISGRGVFRNFKNVLKAYPEVERKFHFYKERKMRSLIFDWYNALRESWGLEKLGQEIEEIDDLVHEDFVFREYNPEQDKDCVALGAGAVAEEFKTMWPGEEGQAAAVLWSRQCEYGSPAGVYGFVCRTLSDEFTGCILVSPCPSSAKKTVIVTSCFVLQNYRGLGIGGELISACLSHLRERGIQWVIIADTIMPKTMEPLLTRIGFEQTDFGFAADLLKV